MYILLWKGCVPMLFSLCISHALQVKITSMKIESTVVSRLSRVAVTTYMTNIAKINLETQFSFQLPDTAFVSNFTMTIGNKSIQGEVKKKEQADEIYEKLKKVGASTAKIHRENTDHNRDMKIFTVTVYVAKQSKVSFQLQYEELLIRKRGVYTQRISIQPKQIVADFVLKAEIYDQQDIRVFYYSLPNSNTIRTASTEISSLEASERSRKLTFHPTLDYQTSCNPINGISGDLVLKYDVYHRSKAGLMLKQKDFFVHFLAPSGFSVLDKNIVFVIDVSGSMEGLKMKQTKQAMYSILSLLRSGDLFNILIFNNDTKVWFSKLLHGTRFNIKEAKQFVKEEVCAYGATDINRALLKAVDLLEVEHVLEGTRSNLIIFLTDGKPNVGETNTKAILHSVREKNKHRFSLFSLGFGFDVDMPFLKALSWENGGFAKRIYAENDASEQLQNFYHVIKSPTLIDVNISYHENEIDVKSLTKTCFPMYFKGSELVVAGKYNKFSKRVASVRGRGSFDNLDVSIDPTTFRLQGHSNRSIVEKIWAYMKINELLKDLEITDDQFKKSKLTELVETLSLEYNFVTPLTSMVITEKVSSITETTLDSQDTDTSDSMQYPCSSVGNIQTAYFVNPASFSFGVHSDEGDLKTSFDEEFFFQNRIGPQKRQKYNENIRKRVPTSYVYLVCVNLFLFVTLVIHTE